MKPDQAMAPNHALALALTWDGVRWPIKKLPSKARAFLAGRSKSLPVPTARELSRLFAGDAIRELRICWVPCLKGGEDVLSEPFASPAGRRLGFTATRITRLGDILGVVYRR
jgi:hypothetical protein